MTDTPQVLLAHHLKTLKLPTFLREYDKLARQCATEGADHVRCDACFVAAYPAATTEAWLDGHNRGPTRRSRTG